MRLATSLPLLSLLERVAVHLTAYSSVVLEAEVLGVPSVLWHPEGVRVFRDQMASGWAAYAPAAGGLVAAVHDRLAFAAGGRPSAALDYGPALDALLARSQGIG